MTEPLGLLFHDGHHGSSVVQLGRTVGCHFPLEACLLPSSTIITSQAFQGSTSSSPLDIVAEV